MNHKKDFAPWLLLPGIVLALSSVTLLTPRLPAQAAPPSPPTAAPKPAAATDDDEGDELLEHWGDPNYSREEQYQLAGMAGGFLLLGVGVARRRARRANQCEVVPLPREADFLKLDSRPNSRKAA